MMLDPLLWEAGRRVITARPRLGGPAAARARAAELVGAALAADR
jgi:hypothetical protein